MFFMPGLLFCETNIYYNLGLDAYFKNELEDSLSNFKKAVSAFPDSAPSWFYLGKTYKRLKMNKEAKSALLKAKNLDPNNIQILLLFADILMEEHDYKNASLVYKNILSIDPENLSANLSLGKAYFFLDKPDDAIFYLEKAQASGESEAFFFLGRALLAKNEGSAAIEAFTKAISLESYNPLFYYWRGNAYFSLADYLKPEDEFCSLKDYRKADEFGLSDPGFFFMYGNALISRGFYYLRLKDEKKGLDLFEQAIVKYKKAIELSPSASNAYNNMGLAYYYLDRTDEAISQFKKAIELEPQVPFFHDNLGDAYYKKGLFEKAFIEYNLVLELSPDYTPDVQKILPFPSKSIKEKIREAKRRM